MYNNRIIRYNVRLGESLYNLRALFHVSGSVSVSALRILSVSDFIRMRMTYARHLVKSADKNILAEVFLQYYQNVCTSLYNQKWSLLFKLLSCVKLAKSQ